MEEFLIPDNGILALLQQILHHRDSGELSRLREEGCSVLKRKKKTGDVKRSPSGDGGLQCMPSSCDVGKGDKRNHPTRLFCKEVTHRVPVAQGGLRLHQEPDTFDASGETSYAQGCVSILRRVLSQRGKRRII